VTDKPMTEEEFRELNSGDLVRHLRGDGTAYQVAANYGSYVIAVRVIHMSNPEEWVLAGKARIESPGSIKPKRWYGSERGDGRPEVDE